ncbi:MAG: response regulator [Acidimicrobiia bacterium]|nr:response regulator [Acidimicrobiia bacterium]
MNAKILIIDDDKDILQFVRMNLELEGLVVATAEGGQAGLDAAKESPPDLVLLDVMMPEMDGLTVLRRLRTSPPTMNVPVILLTAKALAEDRLAGLELGADDYITKPFDLDELIARVKTVLRRAQAMRDLSPLTGLPGNFRISRELERRVTSGEPFALVHVDLDNFKAFNDHYGFMRGDGVIKFSAHVLLEVAEESTDPEVFVGHVGGDDFICMVHPDHVEELCKEVCRKYDDGILDFYDTADALQGFIEVTDRRGERHAFPIGSISMGVAANTYRDLASEWEASAIASEMKEFAKREPGSSYRIDRRTTI